MREHPYKGLPDRQFWSRGVSKSYDPKSLSSFDCKILLRGARVASAGSCFASNMVPYLARSGIEYVRTEKVSSAFISEETEKYGYSDFSAAYGNIYTARQLSQLFLRSVGQYHLAEPYWSEGKYIIDPLRPGLKFRAKSVREFQLITERHLRAVRQTLADATHFFFTLGLTECWFDVRDGVVFPACPGTIAGKFNAEIHKFANFSLEEVVCDLHAAINVARSVNPNLKFVFTVSPVPLVATAENRHVLISTMLSKSILRLALEEVTSVDSSSFYYPSYEMIVGPQAPSEFFQHDKRNVSDKAVQFVMEALLGPGSCSVGADMTRREKQLSGDLITKACEELMSDSDG